MQAATADRSASPPAALTNRQREVLDLLLLHKTSKEIARDLGISPHTVEQRIRFAKAKFGVQRRSDLATSYREQREICDQYVYDEFRITAEAPVLPDNGGPDEPAERSATIQALPVQPETTGFVQQVRLVPAIFEGPTGVLMRIGAVFAISASMIVVGIGGLAVFEQLSRLMH